MYDKSGAEKKIEDLKKGEHLLLIGSIAQAKEIRKISLSARSRGVLVTWLRRWPNFQIEEIQKWAHLTVVVKTVGGKLFLLESN